MIDEILFIYQREMLRDLPTQFHRYMYHEIDWDARLVGLTGPRGVGKSTLILQHIVESQQGDDALYVSADHAYFSNHTIAELADEFVKEGGKYLYIDEVHKYENWSRELKQINDIHRQLKVVFTGSSVLKIEEGKADLSRRALVYHMQGLSFREYLELFHSIHADVYTLDDILMHKPEISGLEHPLPLFREYLASGYYPFALEGAFAMRMQRVVSQTVEVDIPQYADMKASTARKLKQMLAVIAQLAPYKPNADNLSKEIGVSKNNVPDYLAYLEKAGMIGQLRDDTGGMRGLGKVEKIYIDNPSLMTTLAENHPDTGNLRETFFYNQMRLRHPLTASRISDFEIESHTFEVGGRHKGKRQIVNATDGYVVKDNIEYGHGNIIPLWHFGLNY